MEDFSNQWWDVFRFPGSTIQDRYVAFKKTEGDIRFLTVTRVPGFGTLTQDKYDKIMEYLN